jgi:hypothetical protein
VVAWKNGTGHTYYYQLSPELLLKVNRKTCSYISSTWQEGGFREQCLCPERGEKHLKDAPSSKMFPIGSFE